MHIGSPERITLLEFEAEEEENQEAPQHVDLESEEQALEELPECPDHRCTSFLKGKPRSILSLLCFYKYHLCPLCLIHYVIGVNWKHLLHMLSLSRQIYLESFVDLGSNICLVLLSSVEVR